MPKFSTLLKNSLPVIVGLILWNVLLKDVVEDTFGSFLG